MKRTFFRKRQLSLRLSAHRLFQLQRNPPGLWPKTRRHRPSRGSNPRGPPNRPRCPAHRGSFGECSCRQASLLVWRHCGTASPRRFIMSFCSSRRKLDRLLIKFLRQHQFPLSTLGAGHSSQVTSFPTAAASEDSLRSTKNSQLFSASSSRNYAETAMLRQAQSARWRAHYSHFGFSV